MWEGGVVGEQKVQGVSWRWAGGPRDKQEVDRRCKM